MKERGKGGKEIQISTELPNLRELWAKKNMVHELKWVMWKLVWLVRTILQIT